MKFNDFVALLNEELPTGFTVESEPERLYVVIKNKTGKKAIAINCVNFILRVKTDNVKTLARVVRLSFKRAKKGITEIHYGV